VFGAFPSLHVAWPVLLAFFMWYNVCSKWHHKIPVIAYVMWVSFSVVYLHHHFVVDVLGGIFYSWIVYHLVGPHWDDKPLIILSSAKKPVRGSRKVHYPPEGMNELGPAAN